MKTYRNSIFNNNLCTGCGVCISESKGDLRMEWDEFGFLVPVATNNDISNDVLKVCPFNSNPDEEVKDEDKLADIFLENSTKYDDKIGHFENCYAGYSIQHRETSSSGGIATYIFEELLKQKIVDHLFIVKEIEGTYEYQLFKNPEDIKAVSKTRYIPVTLEKLFLQIDNIEGKIAISGVACFIKAIRLKQHYHPQLKEKIPFLVGIICGGWKSRFFTDFLAQKSGINSDYRNQEYRIKDNKSTALDYSFGAYDNNSKFHEIKMSTVGDMWGTGLFKAYACEFCTDVLTELADISLGDAWLPEYRSDGMGNSVIVTRSFIADDLIKSGMQRGILSVVSIAKERIIESQSSSFKHRQNAIEFRKKLAVTIGEKKLPYFRKRVSKSISFMYALVQIQRLITRRKSLEYWKNNPNLNTFNHKMKNKLMVLSFLTKACRKLKG